MRMWPEQETHHFPTTIQRGVEVSEQMRGSPLSHVEVRKAWF